MRKFGIAAMLGLALVASACAKNEEAEEGVPADTATMAPAPAPAPAPMDTGAMMDTTAADTTATTGM
jgi:hypothetical protein